MTKEELVIKLDKFGLVLRTTFCDNVWLIGASRFANAMMSFNPLLPVNEYNGEVTFKVINAPLFTWEQIKGASEIVHEFMMTPLELRGFDYKQVKRFC
jgi:hypothetical protein